MVQKDEYYMSRALEIAVRGSSAVKSNPMVGCVITHNDKVIGEGWHKEYGKAHAEVEAISNVKQEDIHLLSESTIYVNLEPCSHYGKTPPCCDMIISKKIRRVVIGMQDPFDKVSGRGINKMIENGIDVTVGVLEERCKHLNRRFITFHQKKRPYIIFKWAQTLDGYIDGIRNENTPPVWLTGIQCKRLVHKWRSEEGAIMVGSKTVINDNPQLNNRLWMGESPIRITIDRKGIIDNNNKIFDNSVKTIIFTESNKSHKNAEYLPIDNGIGDIMQYLYNNNIISLFVEGGTTLFNAFLKEGYIDEARIFISDKMLCDISSTQPPQGIKAPVLHGYSSCKSEYIDGVMLKTVYK